jgi:hypothetical protein
MNESLTQKEGKAHNEGTAKANRKIRLPEKTREALEKKAKAEGKSANQKAAEIIEAKAKESPFPADAKINDYGFLHFKNGWLENLGWAKGMALKVDKNPDGSVTLRKA